MDLAMMEPITSPHNLSEMSTTPPTEITKHLRQQVEIVHELFELYQQNISKPEQDWIQNAINYTKQILNTIAVHRSTQGDESKLHRRLHSFQSLTSRYRQAPAQAAMWSSQLLIAMQNLNGAMNMLSSYARADIQASTATTTPPSTTSASALSETDLDRSSNRRRYREDSGSNQAAHPSVDLTEDTIAGLRARNNKLRNTARDTMSMGGRGVAHDGKLPLTLVETVEIWRQNAEDALKAAMVQYFEQEGVQDNMTNGSAIIDLATIDRPDCYEMPSNPPRLTASPPQSRKYSISTCGNSASDTSSQLDRISSTASTMPRRKPVAPQTLSPPLSGPLVSAPSTATRSSFHTSRDSAMSSSHSTSTSLPSASPTFNTHALPATTFDQTFTLTPSTTTSPSSKAPEIHRLPSLHDEANTSAISLLSTPQPHRRPSSTDERIDSVVSLPSPLPPAKHDVVSDVPMWQQPESSSMVGHHRKSRGRAWLERAMMNDA